MKLTEQQVLSAPKRMHKFLSRYIGKDPFDIEGKIAQQIRNRDHVIRQGGPQAEEVKAQYTDQYIREYYANDNLAHLQEVYERQEKWIKEKNFDRLLAYNHYHNKMSLYAFECITGVPLGATNKAIRKALTTYQESLV